MGLLADYFSGSYNSYVTYFGRKTERDYVYVLVNNDLSTQEILKQNPAGTKEIGLTFQRSEKYHGINTSVTLEVEFSKDDYAGGAYLVTAFDNKGIRADVDCFIYRKNPDTNDHDLFYEGKVDFNEDSFSHKPNDRKVTATLHEQGLQNKFLTRETIKKDITKNKAIDGTTITGVASSVVTFSGVDIYLQGEAEAGAITRGRTYTTTGSENIGYDNGTKVQDLTGGRINFETPVDGKIYINDTNEVKDVRFRSDEIDYEVSTSCDPLSSLNLEVFLGVYDSLDALQSETSLYVFNNTGDADKEATGSISDVLYGYVSVPVDGYLKYYVKIDHTYNISCILNTFVFGSVLNSYEIIERSDSIGSTDNECYFAPQAMDQLMRLYTGDNNSFYYNSTDISDITSDAVISGYLLRKFPNKGITLSFEEVFNTCSRVKPKCLIYDQGNNRFELKQIDEAYKDVQVLNLGKVNNLEVVPSGYINDIKGGCVADGKYEQDQGINEFNIRHNFTTSFEFSGDVDLRTPLSLDTIGMELTRRQQYENTGFTDTRFDKTNFYVRTIFNQTEQGALSIDGFAGINQYYNGRYNARKCIVNNGPILAGLFYKDTGESISFSSNAKDIDIEYTDGGTKYSLQEDISQTELGTPLFYPEKITFDTDITDTQLAAFRANPHGYITIEDDEGNEYNIYVDVFELKDNQFTIEVTGKLANINR